jgi:hypothetical protein
VNTLKALGSGLENGRGEIGGKGVLVEKKKGQGFWAKSPSSSSPSNQNRGREVGPSGGRPGGGGAGGPAHGGGQEMA